MRRLRPLLLASAATLLAACASQPPKPVPASIAIAAPIVPAPVTTALPPAPAPVDVWTRLRDSFALDDCNADPRSRDWTRRFTGNPARLQDELRTALPLLMYVEEAAERAGVPGEFVLLPMIESSYDAAEPGHHGDPAGMWQIVPQTARTIGLVMNRDYDGRLDPAAATPAVMAMLKSYGSEFQDWRLADMAFNAGEYRILRLVAAHHQADDAPMRLPVNGITRDHLAKLLAMACIVRDPGRFDVELPKPRGDDRLVLVTLTQAADLADAAHSADIALPRLHALNPGYRGKRMPEQAPFHLLLPASNADALLAAENRPADQHRDIADAAPKVVSAAPVQDRGNAEAAARSPPSPHPPQRHKVARGESLWAIARRYHLDAHLLRKWNSLASDNLRPGQMLRLTAPD